MAGFWTHKLYHSRSSPVSNGFLNLGKTQWLMICRCFEFTMTGTRHYNMDFSELTKIIFNRIQKVEPDNVIKIMGCVFLKEPDEQEMVQLAFGPDATLLSKIADSKALLGMLYPKSVAASSQMQSTPDHHYASSFPPGSWSFSPYWDPQIAASDHHHAIESLEFSAEEDYYSIRDQSQFLNLDDNPAGSYYYQDVGLPSRTSRRSPSLPEFPIKACHYFYKGYCKHGANCRYFHGLTFPDGYTNTIGHELSNEDHGFSPGSLEKLEMEITELLRSRRGMPVSIASLPMLYYEKYGRNLQADGYLTESQRHGKAGFSLTKLLARLRNSIRLIDRPHGQHAVILAEDAPRYMDCRNGRNDPGAAVASSHQIYLTFPAESIFSEEDVSNYFKYRIVNLPQYGPVRDVRIPSQEKRMFGFVSFVYPETVNIILMLRNPHYICGARVLVKPYREKSRVIDRKYMEKIKHSMYNPSHYIEMEPEIHSAPRRSESSIVLKKHLIEEHKNMLELERIRLSQLNLVHKPSSCFSLDEFELPEGLDEFTLTDHFSCTLDALNHSSTSDDKARTSNSYSDQESEIDLPESPFASPTVGSSISAVV